MGLQAQMKTSLPWPSSMLTLLAGISSGPASAIAVSPPLACGLLQSDTVSECSALPAVLYCLLVALYFSDSASTEPVLSSMMILLAHTAR